MATISFRVSDKEKDLITKYAKNNNNTISEFILNATLSRIEDYEDYLLAEKLLLDTDNIITGDLRKLAEDNGINYDEL